MSKLSMLTKINDICLYVNDFQGSLNFYKEKFGFKVKRFQPNEENANYVEFDFHGTSITLWDKKGVCEILESKYLDVIGHHFMIAVKVSTLEDVDDISNELISNGVTCIKKPTTFEFGSRAAYFLDFEKNIWEVFSWEKSDGPGLL